MYDENTQGCISDPILCPPDSDDGITPGPGSISYRDTKVREQGREIAEECRHVDWTD